MTPWTIRLALDIVLVDEMLAVNHSMDHPMESEDVLLPVHPQLGAGLAANSLSVQLGKHMLSTASNERVPITDQYHMESNAPFVKNRGPKRGMYNQIAEKSGVWGETVCNKCVCVCDTSPPVFWNNYPNCAPQGAPQAPQRKRSHSTPFN